MLSFSDLVHWRHLPWFACVAAAALHQTGGASLTLEGVAVSSGSVSAISCQHPHSPYSILVSVKLPHTPAEHLLLMLHL